MKAIRIHQYGGPEVLRMEEVPVPSPGEGQALVRLQAVGINFIDVYHRTGLYKVALPFTPGMEGAGLVELVGPNVTEVQPGDRVAYATVLGSYGECALTPARQLIKLPEGMDYRIGAAILLQGMTAHYLTQTTFPLKRGDTALVHAAAGGAGLLIVQMAKRAGARVIGTVSTEEKAQLAHEAGADEIVVYTRSDFEAKAKEFTNGKGVNVVYDSVGKTTFEKSLNCLAPRGTLALFGQSSGSVPPFDPSMLAAKGSLFLTRPSLTHYTATREELLHRAGDVLNWAQSGDLKIRLARLFSLSEAAEAHRQLEGRLTTGKILLLP
jgi:NADPH2:quinone reductase